MSTLSLSRPGRIRQIGKIASRNQLLVVGAVLAGVVAGVSPLLGAILSALIGLVVCIQRGPRFAIGPLVFVLAVLPEKPPLHVGGFPITPRDGVLYALGGLALVWSAFGALPDRKPTAQRWWFLWLLAVTLSTGTFPTGVLVFAFRFGLPFVFGQLLGADASTRDRASLWFGRACIALALLGVVEVLLGSYFVPVAANELFDYQRVGTIRARVTLGHPLALATILNLGFFFALQTSKRRTTRLIVLAIMTLGVGATLTRSSILGLIAGGLTVVVLGGTGRRRRDAVMAIAVTGMLIFFTPGSTARSYREYLAQSARSDIVAAANVVGRQDLVRGGLAAVAKRPIFGYGFSATSAGSADFVTYKTKVLTDVANFPLAILLETGIVGFIAFALVIGSCFRQIRRSGNRFAVAAIAGTVGALVTSLGVTPLQVMTVMFFLLGLFTGSRTPLPRAVLANSAKSDRTAERIKAS